MDIQTRQCDMEKIGKTTLQFVRRVMQDPRYRDMIEKRAAERVERHKSEGANKE